MAEYVDKKRGRRTAEDTDDRRVLMTFQVDVALRDAAMDKANETGITISGFLRGCVKEFIASNEIARATEELQRNVVGRALEEVEV